MVFRVATRCDGPDAGEFGKNSAVPKIGMRGPEPGTMMAKKATAEGHVGSKARNERGEKIASEADISQQTRTQHGSDHGGTTTVGCTIEEVSLEVAFEERQSVLRCSHCGNGEANEKGRPGLTS